MREVTNKIFEKTPSEIEARLQNMGEFVQMSYLQRALNSGLDFETKKFVLVRLAKIYEKKGMFVDAAKCVKSAADINTTFRGQISDYMKSVELYIKGSNYAEADRIFSQALALGNTKEKEEMKNNLKNYYMTQGKLYLSGDRRNYAKVVFEKMLRMDLSVSERNEVNAILLNLYDKLGNVKEYMKLKQSM